MTYEALPLSMTTLDAMEPLHRLEILRRMANMIDGYTRDTVTELREQDRSWSAIADALMVTRQAAQQRYATAKL